MLKRRETGERARVRSLIFDVCVCRFATYLEACLAGRPRSFYNSINDFSNYKSTSLLRLSSFFFSRARILGIPLYSGCNVKGQGVYKNK